MRKPEELTPPKMGVLIADDRAHMRKIVRAVANHIGFREVIEAADGREAVAKLTLRNKQGDDSEIAVTGGGQSLSSDGSIDFIICDWMMPNMTGLEVLETVRKDEKLKKLPFIMLTAENDKENVLAAIQLGVSDYIIKPFTANALEEKILSVLSKLWEE